MTLRTSCCKERQIYGSRRQSASKARRSDWIWGACVTDSQRLQTSTKPRRASFSHTTLQTHSRLHSNRTKPQKSKQRVRNEIFFISGFAINMRNCLIATHCSAEAPFQVQMTRLFAGRKLLRRVVAAGRTDGRTEGPTYLCRRGRVSGYRAFDPTGPPPPQTQLCATGTTFIRTQLLQRKKPPPKGNPFPRSDPESAPGSAEPRGPRVLITPGSRGPRQVLNADSAPHTGASMESAGQEQHDIRQLFTGFTGLNPHPIVSLFPRKPAGTAKNTAPSPSHFKWSASCVGSESLI